MKKMLLAVAAIATIALISCSKEDVDNALNGCKTCTVKGTLMGTYCLDTYTQAQIDEMKTECQSNGGTWASK